MVAIVKNVFFAVTILMVVIVFDVQRVVAQNAQTNRSGTVLVSNNRADSGDNPFVLQAKLLEETADALSFDVSYFMSDTIQGTYSLSIHPDKCDWSYDANTLRAGMNVQKLRVSFRKEQSDNVTCQSSILYVYISRYDNNTYTGKVFDRTIEFPKAWIHKD